MNYLGTNKIGSMHIGSTGISKAYLGSTLVFEKGGVTPLTPKQRLIQLGCIVWFPLDADNGVIDVIGGKVINVVNNSISYDAATLSHVISLGSTNVAVASIDVSYTANDFVNGCWTTVTQTRRYNQAPLRGTSNILFTNHTTSGVIFQAMNASVTSVTNNWSDDNMHTTIAVLNESGGRKFYHNGTQILNDANVQTPPWGCTKWNFMSYASWTDNKRLYFRNYLLFNRALTADEVAEVNTIINSL